MLHNVKYWYNLLKLSRKRFKSKKDYEVFQQFQALELIKVLEKNGVFLANKRVLDVGCYYGGFSGILAAKGAKVSAVDLEEEHINTAKQLIKNVDFKVGSVLDLPFVHEEFDVVIASSLIEHVPDQNKALGEIYRVLKKEGVLYLSFPPFYSLNGGHAFKPFHLLPEKLAIPIGKKFMPFIYTKDKYDYEKMSDVHSFSDAQLYKTTIHKILKLLKQNKFRNLKTYSKFERLHFLCKVPFLREFLVMHFEIITRK